MTLSIPAAMLSPSQPSTSVSLSLSQCFTDGLAGGIIEIYGAAGSGKSKVLVPSHSCSVTNRLHRPMFMFCPSLQLATATAIATLRRNHNGRCVFVFSCGSDPSWVAPLKEVNLPLPSSHGHGSSIVLPVALHCWQAKVSHRCRLHPSFSVGDITAGRVVLETLIDQVRCRAFTLEEGARAGSSFLLLPRPDVHCLCMYD